MEMPFYMSRWRKVRFEFVALSLFLLREMNARRFFFRTHHHVLVHSENSIFNFRAIETKEQSPCPGHEFTTLHDKKYKVNKLKDLINICRVYCKEPLPIIFRRERTKSRRIKETRSHFASLLRGKHFKSVANKAHFIACRSQWPAR